MVSFLINLHTIPHNDKAKTVFIFFGCVLRGEPSPQSEVLRARLPPDMTLGIQAKENLGFILPEILFLMV